jgi:hypothetical protein
MCKEIPHKLLNDLKARTFREWLLSSLHQRCSPFPPSETKIMTENQFSRGGTCPVARFAKLLSASLGPAFRLLLHAANLRQWPGLLREGIDPIGCLGWELPPCFLPAQMQDLLPDTVLECEDL